MKKEKLQRIHWIYSITTGASCVIAGICLIVACLNIYYSGSEQPYSRQIVSEAFRPIAAAVYACAALVLGGFFIEMLLPCNPKKAKPQKNLPFILSQLQTKADMDACSDELHSQILLLQKKRKLHRANFFCLLSAYCIIFLAYALNINNFHQSEINESMIDAMIVLTPCLVFGFAFGVFVSFSCAASIQREIALYRQLPLAKGCTAEKKQDNRIQKPLQLCISVVAIVLIVYGLISGGTLDVLTKAVNICTECIGLG